MLNKQAKLCRQSPLQKAVAFGENALRVVGTVKGLYEAGQTVATAGRAVYGAVQTGAPYFATAASVL